MMLDHLWQSTLFALAVGALTLAFRHHGAHVRHALWLVASLKFFVPFSALTTVGQQFAWLAPRRIVRVERVMMLATGEVPPSGAQAFTSMVPPDMDVAAAASSGTTPLLLALLAIIWLTGALAVLGLWLVRWRRTTRIAAGAALLTDGREVTLLAPVARAQGVTDPIAATDVAIEPGVFGIVRPVLLWPRRISAHLTDDQIQAILAHELAHVRRRDNLLAAAHHLVQAAFWFHPLVWWIGARQLVERERACDEDVLRSGSRPHVYAESILRTCRFHVGAPAMCAAGVTGSDLERRIEQIMRGQPRRPLGAGRRILLAAAAFLVILVPVSLGAVTAAPEATQAVRAARAESARQIVFHRPGGPFRMTNFTVREMIRFAYSIPDEYVIGGPAWIDSERFDVELAWSSDPSAGEVQDIVRNILALQFGMNTHVEQRSMPAYLLTRAGSQLGPQLRPSSGDCTKAPETGVAGVEPCDLRRAAVDFPNGIYVRGVTMAQFAEALNRDGLLRDKPVIDRTGLTGRYDADFGGFRRVRSRDADSVTARVMNGILETMGYLSLPEALEQQLGLTLVEQNGPVDVMVIDRIARPANRP